MERRVVAYAHQGGAWEWPSSTLFCMRQGIAAGASALELDVHSTADGELVYRRCHSDQHHHHVVCRQCGRGSEIELPDLERWAESTASGLGYTDVTHTVEIFGLCADCRR